MKRVCVCVCMEEEFMHAWAHTCVSMCLYRCVTVCCFVCVMHLQTGGTRVPVHAEGWVQAADWSPLQTTPLCAIPGCPQYLKTGSINKGDDVKGGDVKRGRGRVEERERKWLTIWVTSLVFWLHKYWKAGPTLTCSGDRHCWSSAVCLILCKNA